MALRLSQEQRGGRVPRRISRHARQTRLRRMRAPSLVLPVAVSAAHAMWLSTSDGRVGSVAPGILTLRRTVLTSAQAFGLCAARLREIECRTGRCLAMTDAKVGVSSADRMSVMHACLMTMLSAIYSDTPCRFHCHIDFSIVSLRSTE